MVILKITMIYILEKSMTFYCQSLIHIIKKDAQLDFQRSVFFLALNKMPLLILFPFFK